MTASSKASKPEQTPPSAFHAAVSNDVLELRAALAAGERLSLIRPDNGFTPLHTAALNGSGHFMVEALKNETSDPWKRDRNGRRAIDIAAAAGHKTIVALLYAAMYGGPDDDCIIDDPDEPLT